MTVEEIIRLVKSPKIKMVCACIPLKLGNGLKSYDRLYIKLYKKGLLTALIEDCDAEETIDAHIIGKTLYLAEGE